MLKRINSDSYDNFSRLSIGHHKRRTNAVRNIVPQNYTTDFYLQFLRHTVIFQLITLQEVRGKQLGHFFIDAIQRMSELFGIINNVSIFFVTEGQTNGTIFFLRCCSNRIIGHNSPLFTFLSLCKLWLFFSIFVILNHAPQNP